MNKKYTQYVDVFYGNGESKLPKPEGIAATWLFIKAQCGNTHPHAVLPFGRMSAGLYTGGYPTGYGSHMPNCCGKARTFDAKVRGFSHLHQTGTGGIGVYYNYAVSAPMYGEIREISEGIKDETGSPGYYAATLSESGIRTELTVDETAAYHRYHFGGKGKIVIDFSNDGLSRTFGEKFFGLAEEAEICVEGENAVSASLTLHGTRTYFYAVCDGNVKKTSLWSDYKETDDKTLKRDKTEERYGAAFSVDGTSVMRISVSGESLAAAKKCILKNVDFDTARQKAARKWEEALGKIEIDADERIKRLFYSNLYHSLLKPAKWEDGYTDFATLWDMYKTQLPLIFTLYREEGRGIAESIRAAGERCGKIPNGLFHAKDKGKFDEQAKMLATHVMTDAYYRGEADAESVLTVAAGETDGDMEARFAEMQKREQFTHILDIAEGCRAAERIAREAERYGEADLLLGYADKWREAFCDDGLLKEGDCYYEGDRWNYSFRLVSDMEKRIAVCGKDEFVKKADSFFGCGKDPVMQCRNPDDAEYISGLNLHRFDGINNEHDMEAPYVYLFAGRHDRTCEVVHAIQTYMFTEGRGGLPGNNDTGALSSWYVWNALGLFPVSGQNKMLLGSPLVESAKLELASRKTLEIRVYGEGIYIDKVIYNGQEIPNMQLSVREMMQGGMIEIFKKNIKK